MIAGVVGNVSGDIVIDRYDSRTAAAVAAQYALRIGITFVVSVMAVGNSDWHTPAIAVPFSIAVIVGGGYGIIHAFEEQNAFGRVEDIGTWWLVCLCGMLFFTLYGLLGLLPVFNKQPFFRTFPEKRKEAYFKYVKELFTEHHHKESAKLRKRIKTSHERIENRLSNTKDQKTFANLEDAPEARVAELLYQEKLLEALLREELSFKVQAKAVLLSFVGKDPDAFYLPIRVVAANAISIFAISFLAVVFSSTFYRFRDTVRSADISTRIAISTSLTGLQQAFLDATASDLPSEATDFLQGNGDRVHGYMVSLADALFLASVVGSSVALTIFAIVQIQLVLDFRGQVLQARRGIWQFNAPKVAIKMTTTFIGTHISNSMLIYYIFAFIFSFITVIFAWSLTWDVLLWFIRENRSTLIVLIIFAAINPIIKLIVTKIIVAKDHIVYRYCWAAFELYEILSQVVAGVAKSITRFVLVLVGVFISLPRIDRSPFPAWIEYYLLLDSGSKSYQAMIVMYHIHNHPVMRVAAWILQQDASDRRDGVKAAERGLVSPHKRRVANRWRKALFLSQNPKLIETVTKVAVDKKAVDKLVKKNLKKKTFGEDSEFNSEMFMEMLHKDKDGKKKKGSEDHDKDTATTSD